jgi:hypothetical protein
MRYPKGRNSRREQMFAGAAVGILMPLCATLPAAAQGFAIRDLRETEAAAKSTLGEGYQAKADQTRLTLTCPKCNGAPIIDIILGRQTDGTEQRVRSGQTTMADLEEICRQLDDTCRITGLLVSPAVGWFSAYRLGSGAGATAIIARDGDLLTIRGIARSPNVANEQVTKLVNGLAGRIIGR